MRKYNLTGIKKPETFINDPITQVLQNGARKLLAKALEVEINSFLEQYSGLLDDQGKQWIKLHHYEKLGQLIEDVKFINGIEQERNAA